MDPKLILVTEDNPDEAYILQIMCSRAKLPHKLRVVEDGEQAIAWLNGDGQYSDRQAFPLPDILLLDLKLPIKNGFEVLEWVRGQTKLSALPVVILTSSDMPTDVQRARELGATHYFVKSSQLQEIIEFLKQE